MKKKIVLGYVAMVVILAISGYFFYASFILAQKVDFERVRLERGQISVFQFCSEIGKLALTNQLVRSIIYSLVMILVRI